MITGRLCSHQLLASNESRKRMPSRSLSACFTVQTFNTAHSAKIPEVAQDTGDLMQIADELEIPVISPISPIPFAIPRIKRRENSSSNVQHPEFTQLSMNLGL